MLNKRILVLIFLLIFLFLVGCYDINQAPIITSDPNTTATVGEAYTYDVNATDPDVGDTLTYTLAVKPFGMTIHSLFGIISWDPQIKDVGYHKVIVKVSDGDLDITQSFTITVSKPTPTPIPPPVNHAPIIISSPITTAIVGVTYTYDVDATDPDGDVLTYSLTTNPSGMGINSANGVISWVPAPIQIGTNAVTVKASDGDKSDTQSFPVVVVENQPPTANAGPDRIVVMKTLFGGITFIGTGTDPDGTVVSYSWDFGDGNTGTGATVNHTYSAFGTYPVTLTVMDNGGATDPDTMSLEIYEYIQEGIVASNPVDLIEVMAGVYQENVDVNKSLTLQGEDRDTTQIIFGYGTYPTEPPLIISADGVTVSGFTIHSGPYIEAAFGSPSGWAFTIIIDGDSALLTDLNVIKDPLLTYNNLSRIGGSAFWLGPSINGFTFTDSIVESGWNGIYAREDGSDITVRNVEFTYPGDYGILLKLITGATIEENTFICTGHSIVTIPAKVSDGIIISRGSNGIEIRENQFIGSQPLVVSHIGILLQDFKTGPVGVSILRNDISDFDTGIKVENNVATSGIFIHYNNIFSNVIGVNNAAATGLDAIDNWWGNASGPYHPITNPLGAGDTVTDNVGYIPWSISPN